MDIMSSCGYSSSFGGPKFLLVLLLLLLLGGTSYSQDGCPCSFAPKEFDHFRETTDAENNKDAAGSAELLLRTLCIVQNDEEERDPKLSEVYKTISELSTSRRELMYSPKVPSDTAAFAKSDSSVHLSRQRSSGIRIDIIPAFNASDNIYGSSTVCDVAMSIISDRAMSMDEKKKMRKEHYNSCPGQCLVVPFVEIPSSIIEMWLRIEQFQSWSNTQQVRVGDILVSCSQTLGMMELSVRDKNISGTRELMSEFFRLVFWRRIAECKEQKHWVASISTDVQSSDTYSKKLTAVSSKYHLTKRKIFSLVIWIGSLERFDLMESQSLVLQNEQFDAYFNSYPSREYVVPFFSSEVTYSCRPDSTQCKGKNPKFIPRSDINRMPAGWACAQRRPLRTLAHVSLLFDPEFILMIDDDTFVNYELIVNRYKSDMYGIMQRVPIVLGEFQGSESQLTNKGIFAGGSGYLISKAALERLVSNSSVHYAPDVRHHFRSPEQQRQLSVAIEAFQKGSSTCAEDCVDYDPLRHPPMRVHKPINSVDDSWKDQSGLLPDGFLKISVRLIDLCTNLMAGENTCLHSDHSLGRCLMYGANVVPVGMACQRMYETPANATTEELMINGNNNMHIHAAHNNATLSFLDNEGKGVSYVKVLDAYHVRPKHLRYSGMCFMLKTCDLEDQLTCHRFKAVYKSHKGIVPDKFYRHKSYYQLPSSCEVMELGRGMTPVRWCS